MASRKRWMIPAGIGTLILAAVNLPLLARYVPALRESAEWITRTPNPVWLAVGNGVAIVLLLLGIVRMVTGDSKASALARSLARHGDPAGAGDILLAAGKPKAAIRYYTRARAWEQAGRAAVQAGRLDQAAELFRRAGGSRIEEAARLYRRLGRHDDSRACDAEYARWLASRNRMTDAIEAWLRAGEPVKAAKSARLALDEGRLKPNLRSFDAARKAAEQTRDTTLMAELLELQEDWARAAITWREAGDHERAARCFRLAGRLEDAADEEEAAGRPTEATRLRINLLHRLRQKLAPGVTGDGERSEWQEAVRQKIRALEARIIPALEELGQQESLITELTAAGRLEEVIERLVASGDTRRAAEVASEMGRPGLAAELHEKSGRWGEASDLWELAGDLGKAARAAEFAGEDERALALYRTAGDISGQARCMARSGRLQDALAVLHRAERWEEAVRLLKEFPGPIPDIPDIVQDLAEILRGKGKRKEAIAVLQRAVVGVALTPERLAPPVLLARLLHEEGEAQAALEQLDRVLDFDYSYQPAHMLRQKILAEVPEYRRAMTERSRAGQRAAESGSAETRYEILEEVGRGGMGVVYRARDSRLERDVAIKVLRTTRQEEIVRLEREAKAAATLNHPGIVTVYDFEQGFGGYFIVMEFADGDPLDHLLRSDVQRIRDNLLDLMIQAADAVAFAHSHNVIHRDLKPGNLMLTRDSRVKILDFGIAARLDLQTGRQEQVCGTPYYMAPEQIRGEPPTPATDVYSLGATFFHLAAGRPPFVKGNIIQGHLSEPAPDPMTLNPDLPLPLARIILRCLEKDPAARFASGAELRNTLLQVRG